MHYLLDFEFLSQILISLDEKITENITSVQEKQKGGPRVFGLKLTDPQDLLTIFLSGVVVFNFIDLVYIYGRRLLHI